MAPQPAHFDPITRDEKALLVSQGRRLGRTTWNVVRVYEELQSPYIPTGVAAAAIRAYRSHRISAERVITMLRGQVHIDELPARDEIPLESLRGDLQ